MLNLLSYFLFNLSNVVLIILIPSNYANDFLNFYSLSNGIFTFVIFYNFSHKKILNEQFIILFGITILFLSFFLQSLSMLIFFYVFLLLFSDYSFSQSSLEIKNFTFKFLLLLTSLIILIPLNLTLVIQFKILLILSFLVLFYFSKKEIKKLKVKSPIFYILNICLIYHGSLFLISIIFQENTVKLFYIIIQILIGIKLRIFDLKIRDINFKLQSIFKYYDIISVVICLGISFYYAKFDFLVIFIISLLLLNYVKKKYITET